MSEMMMDVELTASGSDDNYNFEARMWTLALAEGYHFTAHENWDADTIGKYEDALFAKIGNLKKPDQLSAVYKIGNAYVRSTMTDSGRIYVSAIGLTMAACKKAIKEIRKRAPEVSREKPQTVDVRFWYLGPNGGESIRRALHVEPWDKIEENYTSNAKDAVDRLLDPEWRPSSAGQLILWYGPPGTGKTTALRALGESWKSWCEFHYITDPEDFFGGATHYMLEVMTGASSTDKWRLLILEDAGELMSADARVRSGAGLSRFLNAVDGLIGQGLRIMILVTTNEELGRLHPAVSRAGRCTAKIEFGELSRTEADAWILRNGKGKHLEEGASVPTMLAELYALGLDDVIEAQAERKVGFA